MLVHHRIPSILFDFPEVLLVVILSTVPVLDTCSKRLKCFCCLSVRLRNGEKTRFAAARCARILSWCDSTGL